MITGAAVATVNRLPVLLLPGDIFARRNVAPVLQQLEFPTSQDISVNDCFKPVSRYWDRIERPEQILTSLPEALRVLTSPSDTGAVILSLPQDVQTEAFDYPARLVPKANMVYSPAASVTADLLTLAAAMDRFVKETSDCRGWRLHLFGSDGAVGAICRTNPNSRWRNPGR